ncbi:MAG: hypothetical protein ABII72_02620 [Parcubacteria group bacterium]
MNEITENPGGEGGFRAARKTERLPIIDEEESATAETEKLAELERQYEALLAEFNKLKENNSDDYQIFNECNSQIEWWKRKRSEIVAAENKAEKQQSRVERYISRSIDSQLDSTDLIREKTRCAELLKDMKRVDDEINKIKLASTAN